MLYREIIAVCSQIRTIHINTLCGQNVELVNVKLAVHLPLGFKGLNARQIVACTAPGFTVLRVALVCLILL